MSNTEFTALVVDQRDGVPTASFQTLPEAALPAGNVLLKVAYSTLNYKDGLAISGTGKIVRQYPMVPGVDLAGTVLASDSPNYQPGDEVVLTGWGVGEKHWGGFAQKARVQSDWLVHLPTGLTLKQSMGIGSAGLTAMLCVMALEEHGVRPDGRPVLVTGAVGGVGSVAVSLLGKLGYSVTASTGRPESHEYLRTLGAQEIIDRSSLTTAGGKPLESQRWAGAIDTVGGDTLAAVVSATAFGGSVAACGNVGGNNFTSSVFPFILRGVNLLGVEAIQTPTERRIQAWQRLAKDLPLDLLDQAMQLEPLGRLPELAREIVKGKVQGRVVIDVNA